MKLIYILLFCLISISLFSQELPPDGGGEYIFEQSQKCLPESERTAIKIELANSIQDLTEKGILKKTDHPEAANFGWPLRKAPNLNYNSYYGISNFVDQNASSGLQDYQCTARTYDGHKGTDYFSWPFQWYLYENNLVEIIAAESGVIIDKRDGNFDKNCTWTGNWNAVYVRHNDESVAWYGHLKKNSLTSKTIGQTVAKGEYLGVLASSGWSTGPHLHFEVYDSNNQLVDPYSGDCNNLNSDSWWDTQRPFRDPKVNAILTHSAPPAFGCPDTEESPNFKDTFIAGESTVMGLYLQDQVTNDFISLKIRRPNGTIWDSWTKTFTATYNASYWYWTKNLPTSGPFGTWQFETTFQGETHSHDFQYLSEAVATNELDAKKLKLYPNPTNDLLNIEGDKVLSVNIKDGLGRSLIAERLTTSSIDLSNLPNGIYMVFLQTAKGTSVQKVVKE